jgi:hypothetical protein
VSPFVLVKVVWFWDGQEIVASAGVAAARKAA